VRKWLHWAWLGACAASVGVGCGSSGGGGQQGFSPTDDGGSSASGGSSSGTSGSGSSSGGSGTSSGADATSSSSGGPVDASLDIAFPDVFYGPDTGGGSSGGPQDAGGDGPQCFPDGITCQNGVAYTCKNGTLTTQSCGSNQCVNGFGCLVCQPGTGSCNGNVGTACNASGTGYVTNNCDPQLGESCNPSNGQCTGDCANVGASYIGCEYYAVTMPNSLLNQSTFVYSVSVSNTSTTKSASISITGPNGYSANGTIPAGGITQYVLPWVSSLSNGNGVTQTVAGGAYHIKSTEPVAVYQFNPRDYTLNGQYSYTNDASLLLPVNAMTQNYYVVAGATWDVYTGTVTIVATQNGTTVTYAAPGGNPIIAGGGLSTTGGTSVTLNKGDVLQISAAANGTTTSFGSDQSGAHVTASAPVEVFGGVDCTNMPANVQYCDHIEEIVLPVETLRNDYLVVRPQNDYATPQQYVKIVGTQAGTTLTYDPAVPGAPSTLNAGQVAFFQATVDFHVHASAPILVGQFMEGQNNFGPTCYNSYDTSLDCGDPSQSVAVATGQFRNSYQFVAPNTYNENYVSIIAPNGATVVVDGTSYSSGNPIGSSSGYWTKPVRLCGGGGPLCSSGNGVHAASSSLPFGIEVYGYGAYTSYMYPGGLNLTRQ
jgi:hypothetical protein